jgi:hypothetical protein
MREFVVGPLALWTSFVLKTVKEIFFFFLFCFPVFQYAHN